MATKLTPTEARQGTGPRAMFWVLTVSIALAVSPGCCSRLAGSRCPDAGPLTLRRQNQIYW